jgi:cell division protein FtsL
LGITIAITAILAVLLLFYTTQIKTNQAKIKKLEEKMDRFESDKDMSEKLLNTIKDIVILNKMYKRGELKWENK